MRLVNSRLPYAAILTKELLAKETWKPDRSFAGHHMRVHGDNKVIGDNAHAQAHGSSFIILTQAGAAVNYLEPPHVFSKAWDTLKREITVNYKPLDQLFCKLFIDGASGSGKTRIGYELFRKLQREASSLGLTNVRYAYLNAGDLTENDTNIFSLLLRKFSERATDRVVPESLWEDVAKSMLNLAEGEFGVVLVHLDEFSMKPKLVGELLNGLAAYHRSARHALVLPVCTGLYTADALLDLPMTDTKTAITMPYLKDKARILQLVKNAARGWLAGERNDSDSVTLPDWLEEPDDLVHFLAEDTAGWPMAAVQLGAHLAAAGPQLPPGRPLRDVLEDVEEGYIKVLNERYNYKTMARAFGAASQEAIKKLVALAMSPLKVRAS